MPSASFKRLDGQEWKQVVFAEVLVPDVLNAYGDIYSKEAIEEFAYQYAQKGYIIDVQHDNVDVKNTEAVVVESFLARPGDPDFIEGSWVVGMKILDDALWQDILTGKINGYSYEAEVFYTTVMAQNLRERQIVGVTEPDPYDGHTHEFAVLLSAVNRPIYGATTTSGGHMHNIVYHTITEMADTLAGRAHNHRYQVIESE